MKNYKVHKTQQTSILSFDSITNLGERQQNVLNSLQVYGSATNLELSRRLGLPINSITPRVNELREMGLVSMDGTTVEVTGRKAIVWAINNNDPQLKMFC